MPELLELGQLSIAKDTWTPTDLDCPDQNDCGKALNCGGPFFKGNTLVCGQYNSPDELLQTCIDQLCKRVIEPSDSL